MVTAQATTIFGPGLGDLGIFNLILPLIPESRLNWPVYDIPSEQLLFFKKTE